MRLKVAEDRLGSGFHGMSDTVMFNPGSIDQSRLVLRAARLASKALAGNISQHASFVLPHLWFRVSHNSVFMQP